MWLGEMWLAKLLQVAAGPSPGPRASGLARRRRHRASSVQARTGVRVLVGQAKDGKAQKAAQEWLSVVMSAALARAPLLPPTPHTRRHARRPTTARVLSPPAPSLVHAGQSGRGASHNASRAVGLVLTAPAARKLNLSRRLASVAAQRGVRELPPVSVVSLSRRNRLKHALSRYVRGRPSLRQQRLQGVRVPPSSLLKLAEQASRARPSSPELPRPPHPPPDHRAGPTRLCGAAVRRPGARDRAHAAARRQWRRRAAWLAAGAAPAVL